MSSGIYAIVNVVNDHLYVGSAVNLAKRWKDHLRELRGGTHGNGHLYRAFNQYGERAFEFRVLEEVEPGALLEREQHYIDRLCPEYNIAPMAGSSLGVRHTEEARRNMSRAGMGNQNALGHRPSEEARRQMSEAHMGKTQSEEARRKMCLSRKGKQPTLGHHHTEETRKKMSLARMGNKYRLGTKASEETRRRMSEGQKRRYAQLRGER